MSDTSQGEGWWLASDGKWYPPSSASPPPASPPPPPSQPAPAPPQYGAPPPQYGAPVQPPPEKKKRSKLIPLLLCIAIPVLLIIIVVAANSGSKSTTSTPTTVAGSTGAGGSTNPSTPSAPGGAEHKVGETGTTSKWAVTVNEVKNPYVDTSGFIKPDAGKHFVAVDMTVANNDSSQQTFSTLLQLSVTDSQAFKYSQTLAGTDLPQLGGDVAPGAANRGWVVFEVPDTSTGLVLKVQGDFTATGTTFALT